MAFNVLLRATVCKIQAGRDIEGRRDCIHSKNFDYHHIETTNQKFPGQFWKCPEIGPLHSLKSDFLYYPMHSLFAL